MATSSVGEGVTKFMHRRPGLAAGGNGIPTDVHRLSFRRNVTVEQMGTILGLPETYARVNRVKNGILAG